MVYMSVGEHCHRLWAGHKRNRGKYILVTTVQHKLTWSWWCSEEEQQRKEEQELLLEAGTASLHCSYTDKERQVHTLARREARVTIQIEVQQLCSLACLFCISGTYSSPTKIRFCTNSSETLTNDSAISWRHKKHTQNRWSHILRWWPAGVRLCRPCKLLFECGAVTSVDQKRHLDNLPHTATCTLGLCIGKCLAIWRLSQKRGSIYCKIVTKRYIVWQACCCCVYASDMCWVLLQLVDVVLEPCLNQPLPLILRGNYELKFNMSLRIHIASQHIIS